MKNGPGLQLSAQLDPSQHSLVLALLNRLLLMTLVPSASDFPASAKVDHCDPASGWSPTFYSYRFHLHTTHLSDGRGIFLEYKLTTKPITRVFSCDVGTVAGVSSSVESQAIVIAVRGRQEGVTSSGPALPAVPSALV